MTKACLKVLPDPCLLTSSPILLRWISMTYIEISWRGRKLTRRTDSRGGRKDKSKRNHSMVAKLMILNQPLTKILRMQ
jgi:hypothetical protein